jgi:hypothetical protein
VEEVALVAEGDVHLDPVRGGGVKLGARADVVFDPGQDVDHGGKGGGSSSLLHEVQMP